MKSIRNRLCSLNGWRKNSTHNMDLSHFLHSSQPIIILKMKERIQAHATYAVKTTWLEFYPPKSFLRWQENCGPDTPGIRYNSLPKLSGMLI